MRLTEPTLDALAAAFREQREAGFDPLPSLQHAITAAANEARDRGITPEALLIQLKHVVDQSGPPAMLGDGQTSALREWMVSACVAAYFAK
jgi:hypothetical protein